MGDAIRASGVTKAYGDHAVLRGIDLEVPAGGVFCLLGPNGAGKTTMLEICEGYRQRDAGTLHVLGFDPEGQPAVLRNRVGIVPQDGTLPARLSVGELLDAFRGYYPRPRPRDELLEVVGLRGQEQARVGTLSGGQRRRVELALALAGNPDLVFLDEPTTGFDPVARRQCWAALANLTSLGVTVVLTTHYLDEAEHLAQQLAVIDGGRVLAAGAPRTIADRHLAPRRIEFRIPEGTAPPALPAALGSPLSMSDGGVRLFTTDVEAALHHLTRWARRAHVALAGLTVAGPTLEETYLELLSRPAAVAA